MQKLVSNSNQVVSIDNIRLLSAVISFTNYLVNTKEDLPRTLDTLIKQAD